jgi:hypothetical protein
VAVVYHRYLRRGEQPEPEPARDLLNVSDERELQRRLDAIVRDALSEISDMPLRVSDERWMQRLDELEATSSKRPRRVAK